MGNTLGKPQVKENELTEPPENQISGPIFTCQICIEPYLSRTEKFRNKNLCTHPFCIDCMIKYIEVKLEDSVARIPCPALHCTHTLDPLSIRPLLSPTSFNKWCDLLCDSTLLGIESCYCPYGNCSALVINECGGDTKKSKCPNCKRWFCFNCKMAWHDGLMCKESRELRDQNDVAFDILADRNRWMRCPGCHHFVDRIEGCMLIKCRCDTSFCYRCGKQVHGSLCGCDKASKWFLWCYIFWIAIICYSVVVKHHEKR